MGGLDEEVAQAVQDARKVIEDLGATCKSVSLPHTEYAVAVYYLIAPAEASSNLARFVLSQCSRLRFTGSNDSVRCVGVGSRVLDCRKLHFRAKTGVLKVKISTFKKISISFFTSFFLYKYLFIR